MNIPLLFAVNIALMGGIAAIIVITAIVVVLVLKKSPASEKKHVSTPPPEAPPSEGDEDKTNWLIGAGGDLEGRNFHVGKKTITIGRAASNYIQTTDPDASRIHCRIVPVASGLQAQDMDSRNGIYVNDKKVKRYMLKDQDELRIGECRFIFHRNGDFKETTQEELKEFNTDILRPTVQHDGDVMTELVVRALQEADGDAARVAEAVDMEVSAVEAIGKKHGVL